MRFSLLLLLVPLMRVWRRWTGRQAARLATEADVFAAGLVPPPEQTEEALQPNRATRRAIDRERRRYERQRRKFDKFVEPQGPRPEKIERSKTTKTPVVVEDAETSSERLIVDVHHSDRKTKVLYEQKELYGEFNFRDTILDQLERYFVYIDRMQRLDADSYKMYRSVGASLLPYIAIPDIWRNGEPGDYNDTPQLSPWFLATRPAFGCIAYGTNPEIEKLENESGKDGKHRWVPKFMYFAKYKSPPPDVQPMCGGDIYKMTVWWDKAQDHKRKHGTPQEFAIFIGNDGGMEALRLLETRVLQAKSKRNGLIKVSIPQRGWRIPGDYQKWAEQHGTDAQHLLCGLFHSLACEVEHGGYSMVRVSAEKDGRYAVFSVNPLRLPYFFQDRDFELTDSGQRRRIFHVVRPHQRRGEAVALHFRGQREFTWAGYNVRITVPGRDHAVVEEFAAGSIDEYWINKKERRKYALPGAVGETIRKHMNEGWTKQ